MVAGNDDAVAGGEPRAFVGVDVGGTHTDVLVVHGDREARGKALTTYDDFSRGVLESIGVAAEALELPRDELLARTQLFFNATTVVTNVIAQQRGAKVGVLVTAGFKDEFRYAGGPRLRVLDNHQQTNVPSLVARADIVEVGGRIDFAGRELVPLDEAEIDAALVRLTEDHGVEALAICFLNSHANHEHEQRVAAIARQRYPDLFVTASSTVSRVRGEYPRWMTTVLNCFVSKDAKIFLDTLSTKLHAAGLGGHVAFFQGLGGGISRERAEELPLRLLGAGPAGGAIGANQLAREMGYRNVLLGDMGGTSFDTGLIFDNEVHVDNAVQIDRFRTVLPLVDVISVGAGGGSIAWISERGVPQVGPQSAGSTPGPAAYGHGGEEPTVTDAMVAMGFIDVENYLGGRMVLSRDAAEAALRTRVAEPMGCTVEEAAAAVHDLVVTNMANAVREVSVNKGYDPRDFVFMAYGGTLPWFVVEIAKALGITKVVVPSNSSVFCARGLLASDFVLRSDQTVESVLGSEDELERVNAVARTIVADAVEEMRGEGFSDDDLRIERSADFQFAGQVHALTIPVPDRDIAASDVPDLTARFVDVYERTYGEGTAWPGAPKQLLNYSVTAVGRLPHAPLTPHELAPTPAAEMQRGERHVYVPADRTSHLLPIYDEARFTPGSRVEGPCIVESFDTTLFVPAGTVAERDQLKNIVLTIEER